MTDAEFRKLVREMRNAQCLYFKHRDTQSLRAAKDYERRVDKELDPVHHSLFNTEGDRR